MYDTVFQCALRLSLRVKRLPRHSTISTYTKIFRNILFFSLEVMTFVQNYIYEVFANTNHLQLACFYIDKNSKRQVVLFQFYIAIQSIIRAKWSVSGSVQESVAWLKGVGASKSCVVEFSQKYFTLENKQLSLFAICYLISDCCYMPYSECIIVLIVTARRPQLADRVTANALASITLLYRNDNNRSMCQKEIVYFPTD